MGGAAVLLEEVEAVELELEWDEATEAASLWLRRAEIESMADSGRLESPAAVDREAGEEARGEVGSGAMGR